MNDWLDEDDIADSTPLSEEEKEGLLPSWVATRGDLNAAEQDNIATAVLRWRRRSWRAETLLDDLTARRLHKEMLGEVWTWAGTYRQTEKNIGIDPWQIPAAVRNLMDDAKLWIAGAEPMSPDRAGCWFHHRLVQIHPFPNGNGRHARAMTDLLLTVLGAEPFSWGQVNLTDDESTRREYISALRAADARDFSKLEAFVRT